ncbi:LLM class flavin-dependent oxidoreductase [Streptomyces rishiriensis]|uniref:LLM class flavin-dependent oxidoreductase n=1 Tax=Streptomyces rishiriensis TaxID=68264 RepID=UPI0033C9C958
MRYGIVILPEERWSVAAERWLRAERLGFDHAWTFDHLMWRSLRESTWFPAVPTLTAAALVTSRIRIGTLVASPNLHHPVSFAKDIMALDDISEGRMICGMGAGADGFDTTVFGDERPGPGVRADRFAEFVELMDLLLRQQETSYTGEHFQAVAAAMHPGCVQGPRVPFAIAGAGQRGMRLAARYAHAWVTAGRPHRFELGRFDRTIGIVRDQLARLDDACLAQGRNPATLDRMIVAGTQIGGVLASRDSFAEASGMFAELGCTDLIVFWPRPDFPFEGDVDVLDEIAPLLHDTAHATQ